MVTHTHRFRRATSKTTVTLVNFVVFFSRENCTQSAQFFCANSCTIGECVIRVPLHILFIMIWFVDHILHLQCILHTKFTTKLISLDGYQMRVFIPHFLSFCRLLLLCCYVYSLSYKYLGGHCHRNWSVCEYPCEAFDLNTEHAVWLIELQSIAQQIDEISHFSFPYLGFHTAYCFQRIVSKTV